MIIEDVGRIVCVHNNSCDCESDHEKLLKRSKGVLLELVTVLENVDDVDDVQIAEKISEALIGIMWVIEYKSYEDALVKSLMRRKIEEWIKNLDTEKEREEWLSTLRERMMDGDKESEE